MNWFNWFLVKHLLFDPSVRRAQLLASERFRKFFPALYRRLQHPSGELLEVEGTARYARLHIVLRTTDAVLNVNAGRGLEDVGIVTKRDVIKCGVGSLAQAARKFSSEHGSGRLKVTIVADRLSAAGKSLCEELFAPLRYEMVSTPPGNAPSFKTQLDVALADSDDTLVFICEDDYWMHEDALSVAFKLMDGVPGLAGFSPHNHPDTLRMARLTRLYKLFGRFYQKTRYTTCTFFAGADAIRKYKRLFYRYDGCEGMSICKVWQRETCLCPCCWTLAEHLHRTELSPVQKIECSGKLCTGILGSLPPERLNVAG